MAELLTRDPKTLTKEERKRLKVKAQAEKENLRQAKEEVSAVLAYAPNGAFFGSSSVTLPWKFGLWTYNNFVDAKGGLGRWIFKTFAEAPVLVSNVAPDTRIKVANNTLRKFGYFRSAASYAVETQSNPKKAKLNYTLQPGQLFYLDSIEYRGFAPIPDSLLRHSAHQRLLHSGDAFTVSALNAERTRIETLMRNNGFYFFRSGLLKYEADTLAQPGFVQLRVQPAPNMPHFAQRPWFIGHTYISIRDQNGTPLNSELVRRNTTYTFAGKTIPVRTNMWRRAIAHRRGERYSLADQQASFDRLYAMGILSSMDVDYVPRDTTTLNDTLDIYVNATLARPYDSAFEMYATLKSNQQVGPGVSYELAKHNAFRAGETVAWKLFGSYEWQMGGGRNGGNSLLNSFELGTQLSFKFPRLLLPWDTSARRERQRAKRREEAARLGQLTVGGQPFRLGNSHPVVGSTTFALNADWRNRSGFFQLVTMGGQVQYNWSRHPQVKHELTLLNLEFNRILNTTEAFDSITWANPALYVSMRDQFIPSVGYTVTYQSKATERNPLWVQATVKEAGNLLSGIYAAAGQSWTRRDKNLLGSPFAQFVKLTAEARYTYSFTPRIKLATRAFVGAVYSYGNSEVAPYGEQFYIGGANSVRAFSARTAGPGGFYARKSEYSYIDQIGDFKMEANAELRAQLFGSLHGAVFLDAGNVWLIKGDPYRPNSELTLSNLQRIALGTGVGLRYDLQYLVLRFDVGVGLHAPYDTGRSSFFNQAWKDRFAFHFAIGYPF
ncbi:MAG: BamA/TamA family outer membrane protein [Bacteroidaceae bacterium]|nr:BamA/TamA family outer membrane protein [Bacteroidaceae bacterium]